MEILNLRGMDRDGSKNCKLYAIVILKKNSLYPPEHVVTANICHAKRICCNYNRYISSIR